MHKYFNPGKFYKFSDKIFKYIILITIFSLAVGLYMALFNSPVDYQQGDSVRIMYIHVPSAWMALFIYSFMASFSVAFLIWKNPLADIVVACSAQLGASFTFITLITGMIWGKPMWGTWWVWDARLTSLLVLFLFYLGYIALANSYDNREEGAVNLAALVIIGFINVPIVKFSVTFWNSLHQPASILRKGGPSIHSSMLKPLIFMAVGCLFYFFTIVIIKIKTEILTKKIDRLQCDYGDS